MSVVQRCPSCGTTSATAGECEACHEAQVRYFCTNHSPGLWLDASTCRTCGARFGDAARPTPPPVSAVPERTRSTAPARSTRRRPPSPAPARAPASISEPPPRYSRAAPPTAAADPWASRERSPWADEGALGPGISRTALWQQILRAALRARYAPVRAGRYRERPLVGRGAGGCVKRLLLTMVLLLLALGSAVFVFGGALLGY
jgi:hypothetical protein